MDASIRDQVRATTRDIGERIRVGRALRRMSLEELGARLGITFQQVQKYENGTNRVAACTLLAIARELDLDVSFFMPANEMPVSRAELDQVKADIAATLATFDRTISALVAERASIREIAERLATAPPSKTLRAIGEAA